MHHIFKRDMMGGFLLLLDMMLRTNLSLVFILVEKKKYNKLGMIYEMVKARSNWR
jgi:hypothetical protein